MIGYRLHSIEWSKEDAERVRSKLTNLSYVEDVVIGDILKIFVKYRPEAYISQQEAQQGFLKFWGKTVKLPDEFPMLVDDCRRRYGELVTECILHERSE